MSTKRAILSILNVLLFGAVVFGIYYWFWSSVANKTKDGVVSMLDGLQYSKVEVSGFPLQKKITINDLYLQANKAYFTKYKVLIKELKISSTIFSRRANLDIGKNILYLNSKNEQVGVLEYNGAPSISASINDNGSINSILYSDIGYRVLDKKNIVLSSAGASELKLNAIPLQDKTDYELSVNMIDVSNISFFDKEGMITNNDDVMPNKHNVILDAVFSVANEDSDDLKDLIQVNTFSIKSDKYKMFLNGNVERSKKDILPYGKLTIRIQDFDSFINPIIDDLLFAVNKKYNNQSYLPGVSSSKKDDLKRKERERIKALPSKLNSLASMNPDTDGDINVFDITRTKNGDTYYINNKNVIELVSMFLTPLK